MLAAIPPRPSGYGPHRELFPRYTGSVFDAVSPAVVAADLTVSQLLDPERAARLVEQKALDPSLPGLDDVLERLQQATWSQLPPALSPYQAEIARAVDSVLAERLIGLAANARMPQVRALATQALVRRVSAQSGGGLGGAHDGLVAADVKRFLERPAAALSAPALPTAPPGPPIGDPGLEYLWRLEPYCSRADSREP